MQEHAEAKGEGTYNVQCLRCTLAQPWSRNYGNPLASRDVAIVGVDQEVRHGRGSVSQYEAIAKG